MDGRISIPQFFAGKSIFITGGCGFIGKVLIEKILRSCPECGPIYMLVRPKKGMTPEERLKKIIDEELYDLLKIEQPQNISKMIPIEGNITEENLGLKQEDKDKLEENVSIVFHCAASIRFDDPLKVAVETNILSTYELVKLALNMKNLKVFLHVSTTYSNCDRQLVDEVLYPPHGDWQEYLRMVKEIDPYTLEILTPKMLGKLPNTYVFTKQIAEHVINDYSDKIPSVIFRPSIVTPSLSDPIKGWIDNVNGPAGLFIASFLGIIHIILGDENVASDCVPVDLVAKSMITAAWMKGTRQSEETLPVYNCSSHSLMSMTLKQTHDLGKEFSKSFPISKGVWLPSVTCIANKTLYYLAVLVLNLLPAVFIDFVLFLKGKKRRLFKIQRKIYLANLALYYFMVNEFTFINDKTLGLRKRLLPEDEKQFSFSSSIDATDYSIIGFRGGIKYLLHKDKPDSAAHYQRLYWLHQITKALFWTLVSYFVFRLAITVLSQTIISHDQLYLIFENNGIIPNDLLQEKF